MKTSDLKVLAPLDRITLPTSPTPGRMESLGRRMKRGRRRILGQFGGENSGGQAYHVMSRTAGGEKLFGEVEKEAFRRLMWRMARFSGVEILTYALMANHFHILVKVPERARFLRRFEGEGGEGKLLEHLSLLYSKAFIAGVKAELARVREAGRREEAEAILETFRKRFCDLSCFVKELKERFSRWFNKHHDRRGTLWMERFKSVLVEDGEALRTMALYIDLNPVRAGLVEDPEEYRWTGYGEACGGSKRARRGLCRVMEAPMDRRGCEGQAATRARHAGGGLPVLVVRGGDRDGSSRAGVGRRGGPPAPRIPRKAARLFEGAGGGGAEGRREVVAGGPAELPSEVVQRRGGDREQGLRGRGVQALPGALRGEAEGRGAEDPGGRGGELARAAGPPGGRGRVTGGGG